MLNIEVIKFEAQDVITVSGGTVEAPMVPVENVTNKKHIAACAFNPEAHNGDNCDCWCHD